MAIVAVSYSGSGAKCAYGVLLLRSLHELVSFGFINGTIEIVLRPWPTGIVCEPLRSKHVSPALHLAS